jgi:hypothetical protein
MQSDAKATKNRFPMETMNSNSTRLADIFKNDKLTPT